jgi:uncharacterized membrane protein YqjE
MNDTATSAPEIKTIARRLVKRLLDIGENRLQLLSVELEEERERLMLALVLSLATAVFGLLTGIALTVVVLLLFWNAHPLLAMSALTAIYGGMAVFFGFRLVRLKREWKAFSASLSQLRKDFSCLAETLR